MKKIIAPLLFAMATFCLTAQPATPNFSGKENTGFKPADNGHVYGKVVDNNGKPVSDASVILLQSRFDTATIKAKQVLLKGINTAGNGEFNFEDLPVMAKLTLQITSAGFATYEQAISFMPERNNSTAPATPPQTAGASFEKDLGKIQLAIAAKELQGVTVTATKSLLKLDIDKKVFNVDQNIVSEGGTAVDVMKNVPSLNVDIDGNVTLRNASPTIFVDGRPTTLTLEQIPANAIETVEIMTNPSAKYDASGGGAGILNIVLKKNRKTGYNGMVRAGVNKYGETNVGADFNVRQNKVNVSASINARDINSRSYSTTNRTNLTDVPVTTTNQLSTEKTTGNMLFGKLGLDYFVTNKTTLSVSALKMHGSMKPSSVLDATTDTLYDGGATAKAYSQRNTNTSRVFNGQGLVLGMKHVFAKPGEEWTVDANYFSGENSNNALYATDYYAGNKNSTILNTKTQQIISGGSDKNFIVQTDYVKPLSTTTKLETGVRAAFRSRTNTNNNFIYDYTTNSFTLIPSSASNYASNDQVYAAYASMASSIKSFSYKIGLRAESSNYSGELTDTKQTFSNKYPVSLFPSIFLSQKLSDNQDIQLSYTRRINRPNFFQLIPFVDSTDNLNITKGNAALLPEFTQSLEANYLKQFGRGNSLLASVYYKNTTNLITRYIYQQTDAAGNTALINSYINANSGRSAGAEITAQNTLAKWWTTSTNLNLYNSKINIGNVSTTTQKDLWSWFGKFNSNFKLPSNFTLQLSAMYQSKTNLPVTSNQDGPGGGGPPGMAAQSSSQGYIKPFYGVDLAIKKSFLNNKATVSLSINDIFKSRQQDQYSSSDYFVQQYNRYRDQQMVRLNLSYSFGKIDALLFKRKSQGTGQTGSEVTQ